MRSYQKIVRQSVSLPSSLAQKVRTLAKAKRTSASKVLVDLIARGMESQAREKEHFLALTQRLIESNDAREQDLIKKELARLTFGE